MPACCSRSYEPPLAPSRRSCTARREDETPPSAPPLRLTSAHKSSQVKSILVLYLLLLAQLHLLQVLLLPVKLLRRVRSCGGGG